LAEPHCRPRGEGGLLGRGEERGGGTGGGNIPWRKPVTFSVQSRVWDCPDIRTSQLASTRAKDAICDAMRDAYNGYKPPDPKNWSVGGGGGGGGAMGEWEGRSAGRMGRTSAESGKYGESGESRESRESRESLAELPLFLSLYRDRAVLFRDMSGRSLHKRGYRDAMHKASLNEGVAAGMLMLAGWQQVAWIGEGEGARGDGRRGGEEEGEERGEGRREGNGLRKGEGERGRKRGEREGVEMEEDTHTAIAQGSSAAAAAAAAASASAAAPPPPPLSISLVDPMCGSGTLLIEAALMACRIAPGSFRSSPYPSPSLSSSSSSSSFAWPFHTWHDFDPATWRAVIREADSLRRTPPSGVSFHGNDIHEGALALCRKDAQRAGVARWISLSQGDCEEYVPAVAPSLVVVNPPWGTRLGETSGEEGQWLADMWHRLGLFLRRQCRGAEAFVLSGNAAVTQKLFLKMSQRWPITVGGIECRVLRYVMLPAAPAAAAAAAATTQETAAQLERGEAVEVER
ncbi:hypothetical protein CLOM_g24674, partial [Closterium sp. NIES-68]